MRHNQMRSPPQENPDIATLEATLAGLCRSADGQGLSPTGRGLLGVTLACLIRSLREGWEDDFYATLTTLQRRRPTGGA